MFVKLWNVETISSDMKTITGSSNVAPRGTTSQTRIRGFGTQPFRHSMKGYLEVGELRHEIFKRVELIAKSLILLAKLLIFLTKLLKLSQEIIAIMKFTIVLIFETFAFLFESFDVKFEKTAFVTLLDEEFGFVVPVLTIDFTLHKVAFGWIIGETIVVTFEEHENDFSARHF